MTVETKVLNGFKPCECGYCDELIPVKSKSRFVRGHHCRYEKHHMWKHGRKLSGTGYYELLKRDYFSTNEKGYVLEHVFVYQEYYKCCMLKWGIVHHKDGNRINNEISNLMAMTRAQHTALHRKKNMNDRFCLQCGSKTTYVKKDGYADWAIVPHGFLCKRCRDSNRHHKREFCLNLEPKP